MPFQSALEEQLKKGEQLPVGWPWRLLTLMLVVFSLSIFIYIGMLFGYKPYLNSQVKTLESDIAFLNQSIDKAKQEQLIGLYSQFANVQKLIDSHSITSGIFDLMEKNTYSSVRYNNLTVDVNGREIVIDGAAPDYDTLIKETALFDSLPEIESVILSNAKISDLGKGLSEIKFGLKLKLSPIFFNP
ncbi:MAG: hypothetical protein AAB607_00550 [Patescibacteria group bacterium]